MVRGGLEVLVEAGEVVPGDIVVVESGDAVAADAQLLHQAALQVAEAPITGESVPVSKDLHPLPLETPLADRRNMLYAGMHVTSGRARVLVVATGAATEKPSTSAAEVAALVLALILGYPASVRGGADPLEQPGHRGNHHDQSRHGSGPRGRDAAAAHLQKRASTDS